MKDLSMLVGYFAHDSRLEDQFSVQAPPFMRIRHVPIQGEKVSLIQDFLHPDECQALLDALSETTKVPVGDDGYAKHYRDGEPIRSGHATLYSETLAQRLYARLRAHLKPAANRYGDGAILTPVAINPAMRFIDYPGGGYLVPHYDFPYRESESCLTLHSLVLFLTTNQGEGATRFIQEYRENDERDWTRIAAEHEVLASFEPKAGSALLFPHHLLHEGQATTQRKTIVRTDILYAPSN